MPSIKRYFAVIKKGVGVRRPAIVGGGKHSKYISLYDYDGALEELMRALREGSTTHDQFLFWAEQCVNDAVGRAGVAAVRKTLDEVICDDARLSEGQRNELRGMLSGRADDVSSELVEEGLSGDVIAGLLRLLGLPRLPVPQWLKDGAATVMTQVLSWLSWGRAIAATAIFDEAEADTAADALRIRDVLLALLRCHVLWQIEHTPADRQVDELYSASLRVDKESDLMNRYKQIGSGVAELESELSARQEIDHRLLEDDIVMLQKAGVNMDCITVADIARAWVVSDDQSNVEGFALQDRLSIRYHFHPDKTAQLVVLCHWLKQRWLEKDINVYFYDDLFYDRRSKVSLGFEKFQRNPEWLPEGVSITAVKLDGCFLRAAEKGQGEYIKAYFKKALSGQSRRFELVNIIRKCTEEIATVQGAGRVLSPDECEEFISTTTVQENVREKDLNRRLSGAPGATPLSSDNLHRFFSSRDQGMAKPGSAIEPKLSHYPHPNSPREAPSPS